MRKLHEEAWRASSSFQEVKGSCTASLCMLLPLVKILLLSLECCVQKCRCSACFVEIRLRLFRRFTLFTPWKIVHLAQKKMSIVVVIVIIIWVVFFLDHLSSL